MKVDGLGQLSQVVGLSLQSDGLSLTRALIDVLRTQAATDAVYVLELFGENNHSGTSDLPVAGDRTIRRFDTTGERSMLPQPLAGLDEAIETQHAIVRPTGIDVERLIIPVQGKIGPMRLIVIENTPRNPWLRVELLQLVEIYGNMIRLMDSRERDPLTGLLNRHTFPILFELATQQIQNNPAKPLTLALLDIDHFKRVNDTYGHLYGDEVLILFARLMERSFRYTDCLFRFGGEEFLVLLKTPLPGQSSAALERFRRTVDQHRFPGVGHVTVSIGYVEYITRTLPTTLIDHADQALYAAKSAGRNQIVNYLSIANQHPTKSGDIDLF